MPVTFLHSQAVKYLKTWQCHVINVRFILGKGIAAPNFHICRKMDSSLRMSELMHIIKHKLEMFNKTKMDT